MNKQDLINQLSCQHCRYFHWLENGDRCLWVHCKKARHGRRIDSVFTCGQFKHKRKHKNEC